jgi:hypothetical protein
LHYRVFDKFDTKLNIHFSSYQKEICLNEHSIISFNKFFEERFEEDLCKHCELAMIYKVEIKKSLEEFCWRHHIEIDRDITFDALKKKEYRHRESLKKRASVKTLNRNLSTSIVPSKIAI